MAEELMVLKDPKKTKEDRLEKEWKENSRKVRGIFRCLEAPGNSLNFSFKAYPKDQLTRYSLQDGREYELPLAVIKHINTNCSYPVNEWAQDANGNKLPIIGRRIQRFQFQPLEYLGVLDEAPTK